MENIKLQDIIDANERIKPYIHTTPLLQSKLLNEICEMDLHFKCENFQKTGAFKIRGACNAVFSLTDEEAKKGVATHSSGNHAAAVSKAAKSRGIKAFVVMPQTAPDIKKKAVEFYGGEIIYCRPSEKSRIRGLKTVLKRTGANFIPSYNDYRVIAGQSTVLLEMINDQKDLDVVIAPVGGGGLLSGTALAASLMSDKIEVYGAEPMGADDAKRSLKKGKILPSLKPNTIADGLLTSLGDKTFPIIQKYVKGIITVSDKEIISAMRLIWDRMKIIVEPSAATSFAAIIKEGYNFQGKKIGVILSGGNVDLQKIPWMLENSAL